MPNTNLLLQRLPPAERLALRLLCDPVELLADQLLQRSGEPVGLDGQRYITPGDAQRFKPMVMQ